MTLARDSQQQSSSRQPSSDGSVLINAKVTQGKLYGYCVGSWLWPQKLGGMEPLSCAWVVAWHTCAQLRMLLKVAQATALPTRCSAPTLLLHCQRPACR